MLEGEKKKQEKEKKKKKEEFITKLSSLKLWSTQKKFWLPAYGLWKSKQEIELHKADLHEQTENQNSRFIV